MDKDIAVPITGPDSPATGFDGPTWAYPGLTKREYFAGLAMQALIPTGSEGYHQEVVGRRARLAVHQADALLKALEKDND
jgi:hypothetical protein